jgi:hypothetical protein
VEGFCELQEVRPHHISCGPGPLEVEGRMNALLRLLGRAFSRGFGRLALGIRSFGLGRILRGR